MINDIQETQMKRERERSMRESKMGSKRERQQEKKKANERHQETLGAFL